MNNFQSKQFMRIVGMTITILVISSIFLWQQFSMISSNGHSGLEQIIHVSVIGILAMVACVLYVLLRFSMDMKAMKKLAYIDELTGLPNRRRFNEVLASEIDKNKNDENSIALLLFDLDRFKVINDCHGHEAGDAVIRQFGERINACIREGDTMARLSGDEFAAIIKNISSVEEVNALAQRILQKMKEAFSYKDREIYAGVSMGAIILENSEENAANAMRMADFALMQSKEHGRGKIEIFDPSMAAIIQSRAIMETRLREAIATEAFHLRYLPMMSPDGDGIVGAEALVRWHHSEAGNISPAEFIHLAEEIGVAGRLGEIVLRKACAEMKSADNIRLAVNISPMQFMQDGFVDTVKTILLETGFRPERLELEITEKILMNNPEHTKEILQQFRRIGVRVALDDFGTGYSSMSYLKDFPLDRIKIDRSFTDQIDDSKENEAFVAKIIELGSTLGMSVTVEGVETIEQLHMLSQSACNELQGFYFSRPLSAEELNESTFVDDLRSMQSSQVAA